jgi:parallel beta-helix repeat protein
MIEQVNGECMKTHIIIESLKIINCCFVFASFSIVGAGEYVVTSTEDSGPGSLREAIIQANNNPGPDMILFQILKSNSGFDSTTGVWTIKPVSNLPKISDSSLAIYGQSQSEFIGEDTNPFGPEIELDGSLHENNGLEIRGSHVEVYHLVFNQFGNICVYLYGANYCRIAGCYIGTDPTGMEARSRECGVYIDDNSMYNEIVPLDTVPNIISGNPWCGIFVTDSSSYNLIAGNLIGLNRTIDDTLPNGNGKPGGYGGIYFTDQSNHNQIIENHICGNSYSGIEIVESSENTIINNYIGTNATWQIQLGNENYGILIHGTDGNAMNNLISGNSIGYHNWYGIRIEGDKAIQNTLSRNSISGNIVGGIFNYNGGNTELAPPTISSITAGSVQGSAGANMTIEIFKDPVDQGKFFLGETVSDGSGNFTFTPSSLIPGGYMTATATDGSGNTSAFSAPLAVTTDVEHASLMPLRFELKQNYPNPFNPSTLISFHIPKDGRVILSIYNTLGQKVEILFNRFAAAGPYDIRWNPKYVSSGLYFCRLQMGTNIAIRKMHLIK